MIHPFKNILFLMALFFPLSAFAANPAVLFVFDGSGSMWGQVDGKTKIELAKEAMSGLVKDFPAGTDLGLISYGHRKEGDCNDIETLASLGSSKDSIISAIQSINPKGKTPLTKAIQIAAEQLKNRDAPTSIIVVSDGKESCNADPCAAAKTVREAGVNLKIHVVGFDVKKDEAEQLQCIAKNGGGKYFAATNASELGRSFAEVKKEVVISKPKPVEKKPELKVIFHDDFNGETLSDAWAIKNANADGMIIDEGALNILTMSGGLSDNTAQNVIIYDKKIDNANYNVLTEVSTDILSDNGNYGQNVGLAMIQDKDNYLILVIRGTYYYNNREILLYLVRSGKALPPNVAGLPKTSGSTIYHLKIEKRKYKYTALYSLDGLKWTELGTQAALGKHFKPALIAVRNKGRETLASFDLFEIQSIEK